MNGGHQTLDDGVLVVQDLDQRSQTVGSARESQVNYVVVDDLGEGSQTVGGTRGVGDDLVLGLVGLKVDAADEPEGTISI